MGAELGYLSEHMCGYKDVDTRGVIKGNITMSGNWRLD
jgi:hypothetical protein